MSAKRPADRERVAMARLARPRRPMDPIERHEFERSSFDPDRCVECGNRRASTVHP